MYVHQRLTDSITPHQSRENTKGTNESRRDELGELKVFDSRLKGIYSNTEILLKE